MSSEIEEFYKRWDIEYDEERRFEKLKNRFLHAFDETLGRQFLKVEGLTKEYLRYLAPEKKKADSTYHKPTDFEKKLGTVLVNKYQGLVGYTKELDDTELWSSLQSIDQLGELILAIQAIDWLEGMDETPKRKFAEEIKKDIDIWLIDVEMNISGESFILYPKGAEELDEALVNENLAWLSDYPDVSSNFQGALEDYQNGDNSRDIVDKLRLSLETLIKGVLDNNKSLENQESELGKFLEGKNVPVELRNLYWKILNSYSIYQNEYAKHGSEVRDEEVEFLIYLTGTFMRHLITNARE